MNVHYCVNVNVNVNVGVRVTVSARVSVSVNVCRGGSAQIHAGLSKSMWRPRGGSGSRRRDNPPPPHPTPLTLIGPEDRRVRMDSDGLDWIALGWWRCGSHLRCFG